jgi:L-malate glycosyltransferase
MDAFTELRRTIYRRYSSREEREEALAAELLEPDFGASSAVRSFLGARRAARNSEPEKLGALLQDTDHSALSLRYLADALCSIDDSNLVDDIFTEAFPSKNRMAETRVDFALQLAAECGFRDFACRFQNQTGIFPPALNQESTVMRYPALPGELRTPLVLQSVFYGDPLRPGRGASGGIGALVLRLGNALAARGEGASTLASSTEGGEKTAAVMRITMEKHLLYYLPLGMPQGDPERFLVLRNRIQHAFRSLLLSTGLRPGVVHVRFIDDASLAVARGAIEAGIPVVMTLTPDPHRLLAKPGGGLRRLSRPHELIILHRLWVGDELLESCKGLMGIGRDSFENQLLDYFPQLESLDSKIIAAVDEGVPDSPGEIEIDIPALLTDSSLARALSPDRIERPVMLTVGRLASIKNQAALAKAWGRGFWRTHNLVIIGGDLENPSLEEREVLDSIDAALSGAPDEAEGCAAHLPGMDAETVALVEAWLGRRTHGEYPDLYIASSIKEEFGLAILEAMGAGLVACAPIRGGAGSYIRQGINGFLVDTQNAESLGREEAAILRRLRNSGDRVENIKRAAVDTVRRDYSLKVMAGRHADFYRKVRHGV